MVFQKSFLIIFLLWFFGSASAQKIGGDELDSLEKNLSVIYKTHPDKAIESGNLILKNSGSGKQKSRVLGLIAVSYFIKNDINKSTELLFLSKDEAEKTGNHELIAQTYGSIAHQYVQLNLHEKAKFYLGKAIEETDKLEKGNSQYFLRALSHLEMGNILYDEKNFSAANESYKNSLKQFQSMIEPGQKVSYHHRRSLYNIGNSYLSMNQADSAELYLNKALALQNTQDSELKFFIYTTLSQVYAERNQFKRAVDSLQTVLNHPDFVNQELRSEIYLNLSRNYKNLRDEANYALYNEKYLELNDSLKQNNFEAINTAINQEQREIQSALSQSDKRNQMLIFIGIPLFVIFLSLVVFLIYKRKNERKKFAEIISNLKQAKTEENEPELMETKSKQQNPGIPNPTEEDLLRKLKLFENSGKFTNPKLNISALAVQLKTNTTYLSEVINKYKNKNFNAYINELRIQYICEKIYNHPEYLNYKISYLAEESGFISHSSFATVFKNITGISPSAFLREAAKRESYKPKSN